MRIALPAKCLALCLAVSACGGSSSETPPPLEPDPTLGRYTGPRLPGPDDDRTPVAAADPDVDEPAAQPARSARSTWGSGRPAPSAHPTPLPAPTMTSPNAAPASSAGSKP